ncbi:EamA family transporter [Vibrio salinus]|uniref:EamA family transporter n=1 Tax=Vibrio salinus TaxID=2899784 RepID=UPI001E32C3DC|nr:EamA family transporter [Vibrio salinus]MCE0495543.1 EamA family transporter [Vibrio salinus]
MNGKDLFIMISVMVIWGVNFTMIKLGVTEIDPLLIAAARFFCATFPIIFFIRRPQVKWRYLVGYGIIFGTGVWGMASCSITFGLSSGMASVLLNTDVLTTVLVGVLLYKEAISGKIFLGMAVALSGLVVSVLSTNGNVTLAGVIFIMISAVCWPLAGAIVRASGTQKAFAFNVWGMLFAPIPLIALSLLIHGPEVISETINLWNKDAWLSVLFQAYPTTLFGYWMWNKMVMKYPMTQLAPLTLLVTVFALVSGYFIYGEQLSIAQWFSCSTFLIGIIIVMSPDRKRKQIGLVEETL